MLDKQALDDWITREPENHADAHNSSGADVSCIAWDCIGRLSYLLDTHQVKIKNGNVLYETAAPVLGGARYSVKMQRFNKKSQSLKVNTRYVEGNTEVVLIPIDQCN